MSLKGTKYKTRFIAKSAHAQNPCGMCMGGPGLGEGQQMADSLLWWSWLQSSPGHATKSAVWCPPSGTSSLGEGDVGAPRPALLCQCPAM